MQQVIQLKGDDAEALVELLDKVLNILHESDNLQRRCLDLLRKLCGKQQIVPKSFILSPDTIQRSSTHPAASGGFADIWAGSFEGRPVALKVFRIYRTNVPGTVQEDLKIFCQEAIIWKRLRHANITPFYGIDETTFPSQVALVCEWMPGGTLVDYLNQHISADRLRLALDIGGGLQYLHEMNVLHGDLCTL